MPDNQKFFEGRCQKCGTYFRGEDFEWTYRSVNGQVPGHRETRCRARMCGGLIPEGFPIDKDAPPPPTGMTDKQNAALTDAADILGTEANQLAVYLEQSLKVKLTLRTQDIAGVDSQTPHRVAISIRSEMTRLRSIASTLLALRDRQGADDAVDA